jgi:DNA-binding GntR family transcriptional regulator
MDHEAILYKIESGNADDASKYMKFHLSRALKRVMADHDKMKE